MLRNCIICIYAHPTKWDQHFFLVYLHCFVLTDCRHKENQLRLFFIALWRTFWEIDGSFFGKSLRATQCGKLLPLISHPTQLRISFYVENATESLSYVANCQCQLKERPFPPPPPPPFFLTHIPYQPTPLRMVRHLIKQRFWSGDVGHSQSNVVSARAMEGTFFVASWDSTDFCTHHDNQTNLF